MVDEIREKGAIMSIWIWVGIALLIVLFIIWRVNIRRQGTWIETPSNPHAYVKPELLPLVQWLANKAESQIGRGINISQDAFALSTMSDAVEEALAEQSHKDRIEISIPAFVGDKDGMYGFNVTLEREQLKQFNWG
jgi:hypothetical protein